MPWWQPATRPVATSQGPAIRHAVEPKLERASERVTLYGVRSSPPFDVPACDSAGLGEHHKISPQLY